ncbi:hypothetical protein BRADI_1g60135v3, partial [Brachypodium distachyon]
STSTSLPAAAFPRIPFEPLCAATARPPAPVPPCVPTNTFPFAPHPNPTKASSMVVCAPLDLHPPLGEVRWSFLLVASATDAAAQGALFSA